MRFEIVYRLLTTFKRLEKLFGMKAPGTAKNSRSEAEAYRNYKIHKDNIGSVEGNSCRICSNAVRAREDRNKRGRCGGDFKRFCITLY